MSKSVADTYADTIIQKLNNAENRDGTCQMTLDRLEELNEWLKKQTVPKTKMRVEITGVAG